MTDTLSSPKVVSILARLFSSADRTDPEILARIQKEADERFGGQRYAPELAPLFDRAYLPVPPEVGRLLYVLTRAKRPKTVVEAGTSFGVSAIHIGCALKDNREGRLVSAELSQAKAAAAAENLKSVGLSELVEIRCGDAFQVLKDIQAPIDMLFLDGWKDGYLPLLKMLESSLAAGALVIGDDTKLFPERLAAYLSYVREAKNGYHSIDLPIGDGVELSVRT
jgi:predicted O-methyltransferase YrrM